jgi:hypothetical protein
MISENKALLSLCNTLNSQVLHLMNENDELTEKNKYLTLYIEILSDVIEQSTYTEQTTERSFYNRKGDF